jgi:hypothetical protein
MKDERCHSPRRESRDRKALSGMVEHRRGVYEVPRTSSVFAMGDDDDDIDDADEDCLDRDDAEVGEPA